MQSSGTLITIVYTYLSSTELLLVYEQNEVSQDVT